MSGVQGFIGSWREEEKSGYDEMANAIGRFEPLLSLQFISMRQTYAVFFLNTMLWKQL